MPQVLMLTTVLLPCRIVKLISPDLNYFVVIGAIMLYEMICFRVYRSGTLLYAEIKLT